MLSPQLMLQWALMPKMVSMEILMYPQLVLPCMTVSLMTSTVYEAPTQEKNEVKFISRQTVLAHLSQSLSLINPLPVHLHFVMQA